MTEFFSGDVNIIIASIVCFTALGIGRFAGRIHASAEIFTELERLGFDAIRYMETHEYCPDCRIVVPVTPEGRCSHCVENKRHNLKN